MKRLHLRRLCQEEEVGRYFGSVLTRILHPRYSNARTLFLIMTSVLLVMSNSSALGATRINHSPDTKINNDNSVAGNTSSQFHLSSSLTGSPTSSLSRHVHSSLPQLFSGPSSLVLDQSIPPKLFTHEFPGAPSSSILSSSSSFSSSDTQGLTPAQQPQQPYYMQQRQGLTPAQQLQQPYYMQQPQGLTPTQQPFQQQLQQPYYMQQPFQQQLQQPYYMQQPPKSSSWFPSVPASSCPGEFLFTIDGIANLSSEHYKKGGYHQITVQIGSVYGNSTVAGRMWIDKNSAKDNGINFIVKDTFNDCKLVTANSTGTSQ